MVRKDSDEERRIVGKEQWDSQGTRLGGHDASKSGHFQSGLLLLVYPQLWSFASLVHPVNLVEHLGDLFLDNAQIEHDVAHGHLSVVAQQF